jgi:hypothetical protein
MLFLRLYLASSLLGAALPTEVLHKVEDAPMVKALARDVHKRLFGEIDISLGVLEALPFHLRMRERLQDRVRPCIRLTTTATVGDWALLTLPKYLFRLCYVVRPVRLTGKYGRRLLGRLL